MGTATTDTTEAEQEAAHYEATLAAVASRLGYPTSIIQRWLSDALAGYQFTPGSPAYRAVEIYAEVVEQ